MAKAYNFTSHDEIDAGTASYILEVADATNISDISLEDINDFLNQLEDWADEQEWLNSVG